MGVHTGLPEPVRIVRIESFEQRRPVDRIGNPGGEGLIGDVVQDRLVLIFALAGSAVVSGADAKHGAVPQRARRPGKRQARVEVQLFSTIWIGIPRRPQPRYGVHVDEQIVRFLERREIIVAKPDAHREVRPDTPFVLGVSSEKVLRSETLADEAIMERAGARIQITRVLDLRRNVRQKILHIGERVNDAAGRIHTQTPRVDLDAGLDIVRASDPREIIDNLVFIVRKWIAVEERRGTGAGGFDESGRARLVGSADRNGGISDVGAGHIDAPQRVAVFRRCNRT